jgi:hypothetical protein
MTCHHLHITDRHRCLRYECEVTPIACAKCQTAWQHQSIPRPAVIWGFLLEIAEIYEDTPDRASTIWDELLPGGCGCS